MYRKIDKVKLDFWHKTLGIVASLIKIAGAVLAVVAGYFGYTYFSANGYEEISVTRENEVGVYENDCEKEDPIIDCLWR